jgi:hypothetical protein
VGTFVVRTISEIEPTNPGLTVQPPIPTKLVAKAALVAVYEIDEPSRDVAIVEPL